MFPMALLETYGVVAASAGSTEPIYVYAFIALQFIMTIYIVIRALKRNKKSATELPKFQP